MSLGSGVTPASMLVSWSLGAPNPPCNRESCRHQHERAKVVNGRVEYSPCKVMTVSAKDEEGRTYTTYCDCSTRM